jgi:hypothetical protein
VSNLQSVDIRGRLTRKFAVARAFIRSERQKLLHANSLKRKVHDLLKYLFINSSKSQALRRRRRRRTRSPSNLTTLSSKRIELKVEMQENWQVLEEEALLLVSPQRPTTVLYGVAIEKEHSRRLVLVRFILPGFLVSSRRKNCNGDSSLEFFPLQKLYLAQSMCIIVLEKLKQTKWNFSWSVACHELA